MLITLLSNTLLAQTEEDFNDYGLILFNQVTDTAHDKFVDFIRIREYHEIIDRQQASDNQKDLMKHKVNEDYNVMYVDFQESMGELIQNYLYEIADGSTFEYIETRHEPLEASKDTYAMKTNFLYKNGRMQTQVSFVYEVAWLDKERGFVLISGVKEDF